MPFTMLVRKLAFLADASHRCGKMVTVTIVDG